MGSEESIREVNLPFKPIALDLVDDWLSGVELKSSVNGNLLRVVQSQWLSADHKVIQRLFSGACLVFGLELALVGLFDVPD